MIIYERDSYFCYIIDTEYDAYIKQVYEIDTEISIEISNYSIELDPF